MEGWIERFKGLSQLAEPISGASRRKADRHDSRGHQSSSVRQGARRPHPPSYDGTVRRAEVSESGREIVLYRVNDTL